MDAGVGSGDQAAAAAGGADELLARAMTFNVRFDNPNDGPDAWPYRVDDVVDVVVAHRPSVMGLQETLLHQVHQLETRLNPHSYSWVGVGRDDGNNQGEFSPIFYHTPSLALDDWGTFWLSFEPDEPGSRHPDAKLPRICTWAKMHHTAGPLVAKTFFVFNTHFDHVGRDARAYSADLLLRRIQAIAGLHPTIVTCDLNCTREEATYTVVTASFLRDALAEAPQPSDDLPTFTTFDVRTDDNVGRTIDYVFISGFEVTGYQVVRDRKHDGRRISDHRPIVADLRLKA